MALFLMGFGLIYINLNFVFLHRVIYFPKWREISWKFVFRGELDYNQYQLKYLEGKQPKHRSLQISLEYIDQSSDVSIAFAWWNFYDKISFTAWNYEILQMYFIPPFFSMHFKWLPLFLNQGDWISIVKYLLLVWFNDTLLLVVH